MANRLRLLAVFIASGCGTDASPPAAPTDLTVAPLGAGAHVTWKDNSSDEDEFIVMRQEVGTDTAPKEIARVVFNTTSYHDEPVTSGKTYMYMVHASNAGGETAAGPVNFVAP
jgi:large repetitive protein